MSGLEVEDFSISALKDNTAAEDVSSLKVADEEDLAVFGNIKAFAVHLFVGDLEIFTDTLSDGTNL